MNGTEIEHLLTLIDANLAATDAHTRGEVFDFLGSHQEDVLTQLRASACAVIPTSHGSVTLKLADLKRMVAAA